MKLSSFFKAMAAGVLALLLIGAGGCNWLKSQNPMTVLRGGEAENPAAAIFVPKQAAVMVSVLVNPDRLAEISPGNRGRAREQLDKIKQSLLANTDLDYRRDIQPWLGDEITLAVTTPDIDSDLQNGKQPGYLLAVTTKDPNKSREFVELFWQKRAIALTQLVYEQYQGVNLIYSNQQTGTIPQQEVKNSQLRADTPSPPLQTPNYLASAVVGDRFILFANSPKVLRDAINNVQANLSLNNDPSYQQALQKLTSSRIVLSFVNLPALAKWIGSKDASSNGLTQQPYQGLAIALAPNQEGLLADTALLAASEQQIAARPPALQEPVGALQYIPANSGFAVAGTNLNQFWNQLSSSLQSNDTLSQLLNQSVATLSNRWGIQLPEEIFRWVEGEYALALLPRTGRDYPDWIFVADKSAAKAEKGIEHLDAVARQQGFSVGSLPLEDKNISAWTKLTTTIASKDGKDTSPVVLNAQVQGVHATAGKYEIFTTSIEAMDQALKAADNSLIASDKFKQAIAALPQPNDGYLYLDWGASQTYLERQLPIIRVVELIGQPLFSNLRSLTVSSYGSEAGLQRSKIFLQLGTVPTS